ncbi:MAG TPA: protein-L-isoaspartate(D-aspartate) O-methyltransferase [Thermoanaerobaculales bacterium]|nr:protein-L-isoaspartate(D-aspartate) O-methyltransferase [Thermoanaerobaculales bacterium]HPA80858.1 protein-L-isoaspartate(D-aspartate) O-methyltransferase [Thermoanaerobaculales bacterium]HQL30685.1 protein-L-isoaspartate(D-aspartate) O-methyltransferase [Thermoanaerobaculales bacterium]HQN96658.1 protein-L-isoaspartate(D-aspartate) O-methyltransferase [Thermoanaerobaculales bacterium]HQP44943.1 protein-L-isoaspartate(D-aspartate) O-methyltransferase [Thermoanaerobaculales bacterium]
MTSADRHAYRRQRMVELLRHGGVADERVLAAMAEVPRHQFVPPSYRNQAYSEDVSINIGDGQTISQPRVVALMTEAARVEPDNRVLEIGTGSGYQAAVLAKLARFVFTVERIPSLARAAKQRLDSLGIENVSVKVMDGTLGWSSQAPYDAILVTAAAPEFPQPLLEQLVDGGRLVIPVGSLESQALWVAERRGDRARRRQLQNACFVPLIGRHGWQEGNQ